MSNIIKRRVQVTGGSTFIVSLPKEWVRNVGLTQGSEVLINILPDHTLKIIPSHIKLKTGMKAKEIEVSLDNISIVTIEILSAYLSGYNVIRVKCKDIDVDAVRKIVNFVKNKAIGLEVLEEKSDELTLYSVINTSSLTIREALEKMMNTTKSMLEDVERTLIQYDEKVLWSIIERDDVVDKLFLLIVRQLNQLLLGELSPFQLGLTVLPEALYMAISVKSIERIADHAVLISKNILEAAKRITITDQIVNLFSKTREAYVYAIRGLRDMNKRYVNKFLTLINELQGSEEHIRQNITNLASSPEIYLILDSMRRIRAYSLDIVESTINMLTIRELNES